MTAYLDDIESDLSVLHRIDDPYTLPAERVFRLARRLAYYEGVIRAKVRAEARAKAPATSAGPQEQAGMTWVPATPDALRHSPLADVVSF